mmetsp:Transcript_1509/g.6155  ORF Transcript_1509/g.6155 Transcript_1509/m.6155 type:complete len:306 (+) Transcript_1509:39-956(+)
MDIAGARGGASEARRCQRSGAAMMSRGATTFVKGGTRGFHASAVVVVAFNPPRSSSSRDIRPRPMRTTLLSGRSPSRPGGPSVISYASRTAWSTRRLSVPSSSAANSTPFALRTSSRCPPPASPSSPSCAPDGPPCSHRSSSSHVSNFPTSILPSATRHAVRMLASCTSESGRLAYFSTPLAQNPGAGAARAKSPASVGLTPALRPADDTAPWLRITPRSTTLRVERTIFASALIPATSSDTRSRSLSETKSHLFSTTVSACAICSDASFPSDSCRSMFEASTSVTTASSTAPSSSRISSSTQSS